MYTLDEKIEVRDFLADLEGVDAKNFNPYELDDYAISVVRRLTIFKLWNVRRKIKLVLKEIYKSIKK